MRTTRPVYRSKVKTAKGKAVACEGKTALCSGELLARYGVNDSQKEGQTFVLCGACVVYLGRTNKIIKTRGQR